MKYSGLRSTMIAFHKLCRRTWSLRAQKLSHCQRHSTHGYPSLTHSFGVTTKHRITKFGLKKLETLLYHTVFIYLQTIISFCHNPRVSQTDRRTDVDSKTVRMRSQSHSKKLYMAIWSSLVTFEANELLDDCIADETSLLYVGFTTSS